MTIRVVFTGKLSMTRDEAEAHAERYGLHVQKRVDFETDYLVVGERPGNTKLQAARNNNVRKINESEYLALGAGQNAPKAAAVVPAQGVAATPGAGTEKPRRARKKKLTIEQRPEWLEGLRARAAVRF